MTPAGIEPATFRFVAQHLSHCATAVPLWLFYILQKQRRSQGCMLSREAFNLLYVRSVRFVVRRICGRTSSEVGYERSKGKVHRFTGTEALYSRTAHRGSRCIVLLFLDHGTRRGEGSASGPGRSLPLGKTRYPLYRRLGGPQGWSGQVRKILPHRDSIPGPSSP